MGVMESPLDRGRLVVTPHAITLEGQRNLECDLRHGESLYAFLARHVDLAEQWEVAVDGDVVPVERWTQVYPNHGQVIECRSAVGKSVLRIVALLALTYFTLGAGGIAGGAFLGYTGAAGWIAAGATYVGGSILINKVLAPKPANFSLDSKTQDPTFNLSGTRNTFRAYEPDALLFGKAKITPDLSSNQPYTLYRGNDQYLATTLCCGINVDRVDALYNGEALLSSFDGVEVYHTGFDGMTDDGLPLYSNTDTVAGGSLDSPVGTYVQRTSADDSVRLEIDLEYNIYNYDSKGKPKYNTEGITIQWRLAGSGTWDNSYTTSVSGSKPKVQRWSIGFNVTEGQYEVRVKRNGSSSSETDAHCEVSWTSLRAIQNDTGNYKGLSRIGVVCKATGQLNGALDELRCVAYSKDLPYWNGSAWVTDSTRISNPGAQYLKFLRGHYDEDGVLIAGYGLPDSMIDLEAMKGFILHCQANGYTYDYYLKDARSRSEVLDAIAAAGFGQRVQAGGKYSVAWAADEQPLSGVVNMATIKRGQFQADYTLAGAADGIEATYLDASDWTNKVIRVSAPGVTTPLNPARIALEGVTDEVRAAEMARYHLGQSLYQYKSIQYGTDLEHLSYGRLSVLALQHDLTQWGYGGRVQSAELIGGHYHLTLDEAVPAPASGNAYIGLRIPGEDVYRVFQVATFTGTSKVITLAEAWPVDAAVPGDTTDNPAQDTVWIYDFKSEPGYRVRVVQVEPEAGLKGATVTCVPESDEFWTYVKTGEYSPPVGGTTSVRPVATNLQATESEVVQGNTTFNEIHVTFDLAGRMDHAVVMAQYTNAANETDGILYRVADTRTTEAVFRSSGPGTYNIFVRPYSVDGIVGGVGSVDFVTDDPSIPNWDNFAVTEIPGGIRAISWSYESGTIQPADIAGCAIRYIEGLVAGDTPDWDTMTPFGGEFFPATFESALPEAGDWTFAYRAYTTAGVTSFPDYIEVTLAANLGGIVGPEGTLAEQVAQAAADNAATAAQFLAVVGDVQPWDSTVTYVAGDNALFSGRIKRSTTGPNLNHTPASGSSSNAYWGDIGSLIRDSVAQAATLSSHGTSISNNTNDISVLSTNMTGVLAQISDPDHGLEANASAVEGLQAEVTTQDGVITTLKAQWFVSLDVNGKISGVYSVNDGVVSTFGILADVFAVVGTGDALTWEGSVLSAIKGSNSVKLGAGFGSDSDKLIFAYGPDGSSSTRTFATSKVAITASGKVKFAGLTTNYGSGWSSGASISTSYNTSSPATVTVNVASGTFYAGGTSINYSSSSGTVSQSRGTTQRYWCYYYDAGLSGGAKTLQISTSDNDTFKDPDVVLIGYVDCTVPAGSSSGSGGSGIPGCVWEDSYVLRRVGAYAVVSRAAELRPGDWLRVINPRTGAERWGRVSRADRALEPCVRVETDAMHLTCSMTAPLGTQDGQVLAPDALGALLAQRVDGVFSHAGCVGVINAGERWVMHVTCENDFFLAGDDPRAMCAHHNVKAYIP